MNYDNLCVYIGPLFIVVQASTWGAQSLHIGPTLVAEDWNVGLVKLFIMI